MQSHGSTDAAPAPIGWTFAPVREQAKWPTAHAETSATRGSGRPSRCRTINPSKPDLT